jgi:trimeric autotransporter adhesin
MNPLIQLRKATLSFRIVFTLGCFLILPMAQAAGPDTDGSIPGSNNGEGVGVLVSRTAGVWNTGTGYQALNHLTSGNQNTAIGLRALFSDTNGGFNTATGVYALYANTSGFYNSATGAYALANNTEGSDNTANGYSALYHNTTGVSNTVNGWGGLYRNTTGFYNTANGDSALFNNIDGDGNTATGVAALLDNIAGNNNTANGVSALVNSTGSNNIAFGFNAGHDLTTGDNNIDIGNLGVAAESSTIRIGSEFQTRTFIAAIRGVTTGVADAVNVVIDSNGQLGTLSSSRRFKNEIKPMDQTSEAVLALKPVTFHYKSDQTGTPQFGLIAEDVAKVNPDLVVRDKKGEIETVRYEAVNAMLLNEFIKAHRKMEEQGAMIAQQQRQIEALTAGLQKVSAQVELNRPAPQTVVDSH